MAEIKLSKICNLLLKMSGGLKPKDLNNREIKLLEKEFGKNWFEELGYDSKKDKLPFSK